MKFPLVGSAVLFSLFLLFKFLPKELVNAVLSGESRQAAGGRAGERPSVLCWSSTRGGPACSCWLPLCIP